MTSQDMRSSASLGTMATPRVEVSVRQWLTENAEREKKEKKKKREIRYEEADV